MTKSSVGIVEPKDFSFGHDEADGLSLDCGRGLSPVTVRYETYGRLNARRSNAVLILHALSGNAHVAGLHAPGDPKPGWWDEMVGPGKPFDTERYFIVCSNVIGGCSGSTGPRSANPETGARYNMSFPVITIADMVKAQQRLTLHLGIDKWLSVGGGSMGGMQALEWAVSFPGMVNSVMPIATTSSLSPQGIAFNWVGRQSIMGDPNWAGGDYEGQLPETGLSIARMLGHITYLSEESMDRKFGRRLRAQDSYSYDFDKNFEVESYLEHQGQRFVDIFDANSYLYISRAMDYFNLADKGDGDLAAALAGVGCPFLVVSFSSDWLFPPEHSRRVVRALRNNNVDVTYCEIKSSYGHDAFLLEVEVLGSLISDFLGRRLQEVENGK